MSNSSQPRENDLQLSRRVAGEVLAICGSAVQRIAVIGSRAKGTARQDSDLDLVVFVEPAAGTPPWRSADFAAERRRVQSQLASAPVRVDLSVRTTDRFAEARGVIGGVEWLVAHEGVDVFTRPFARNPAVRLGRDLIRRQNVSSWIEPACLAFDAAVRLANDGVLRGGGDLETVRLDDVVTRALTAVLVAHQVYVAKEAGLTAIVEALAPLDRQVHAVASGWRETARSLESTLVVLRSVVERLCADPQLAQMLAGPRARLSRQLVFVR
jgi:predicted nucleotidyltransferase